MRSYTNTIIKTKTEKNRILYCIKLYKIYVNCKRTNEITILYSSYIHIPVLLNVWLYPENIWNILYDILYTLYV